MATMGAEQTTRTRPSIERQPALPTEVVRLRWDGSGWARLRQEPAPGPFPPPSAEVESAAGDGPDGLSVARAAVANATVPGEASGGRRSVREWLAGLAAILAPGRRATEGASR